MLCRKCTEIITYPWSLALVQPPPIINYLLRLWGLWEGVAGNIFQSFCGCPIQKASCWLPISSSWNQIFLPTCTNSIKTRSKGVVQSNSALWQDQLCLYHFWQIFAQPYLSISSVFCKFSYSTSRDITRNNGTRPRTSLQDIHSKRASSFLLNILLHSFSALLHPLLSYLKIRFLSLPIRMSHESVSKDLLKTSHDNCCFSSIPEPVILSWKE